LEIFVFLNIVEQKSTFPVTRPKADMFPENLFFHYKFGI